MTGKTALFAWVACACLAWGCGGVAPESPSEVSAHALEEPEPIRRFGVVWEDLVVDSGRVSSGESLSHLLDPAGIGPGRIATLAANSRATYDVRNMKAGQRWWLASETVQDSTSTRQVPKWFVYERNPKDYALFSLQDTLGVRLGSHPVDTVYARAQGTIETSLYQDLESLGHSTTLAVSMANVYAWTVDFSRVQKRRHVRRSILPRNGQWPTGKHAHCLGEHLHALGHRARRVPLQPRRRHELL